MHLGQSCLQVLDLLLQAGQPLLVLQRLQLRLLLCPLLLPVRGPVQLVDGPVSAGTFCWLKIAGIDWNGWKWI